MKLQPTIAAIIPTFRREPYLVATVRQLLGQSRRPDEIVVVDQTPPEEYSAETISFLEAHQVAGDITWIRLDLPAVSRARNVAAVEARAEILLYLDDDITMSPDFVGNHIRHFENNAIVAVVGNAVNKEGDVNVPVPERFASSSRLVQAFTYRGDFAMPMEDIGFMYGGNFSVRKSALIQLGGWDEHILNYGDRDLGLRLVEAGFRMDYDPEARIVHLSAARGGTRIHDSIDIAEPWRRCVSIHYVGLRHLSGWMYVKYGLFRALRFSVLLKANALRPHRWPREIRHYFKALGIARTWIKEGIRSPFVGSSDAQVK